jgi:hypothetical protein
MATPTTEDKKIKTELIAANNLLKKAMKSVDEAILIKKRSGGFTRGPLWELNSVVDHIIQAGKILDAYLRG